MSNTFNIKRTVTNGDGVSKALLCDPTCKCCIDGSDEDRAIIDRALRSLAQPEQEPVSFPSFMRKRIKQAMEDAMNPKGMSVHNGKVTVYASDLHRMLLVNNSSPPRKEWVGLSVNEGRDFFESKLTRAELIAEINEFLEEKNT
jgi:hypothetical protein